MESLQVKQTWTQGDLVAIVLCHTFSSSVLGISIISYTCEMENHGASQHCFFFFYIYIYILEDCLKSGPPSDMIWPSIYFE